jgi:hypothetical protein
MKISKLDNGEIVVYTNDCKACVVFNKDVGTSQKHIELYVKDKKLFSGRDAIYIDQDILEELNLFAATFMLLLVSSIIVNLLVFPIWIIIVIFVSNLFVALKCLSALDKIRQSITCAKLCNEVMNMVDEAER